MLGSLRNQRLQFLDRLAFAFILSNAINNLKEARLIRKEFNVEETNGNLLGAHQFLAFVAWYY